MWGSDAQNVEILQVFQERRLSSLELAQPSFQVFVGCLQFFNAACGFP